MNKVLDAERALNGNASQSPMTPQLGTAAVETRRLVKTYGMRPALRSLNLDVGIGDRLAIVGPNGSGKSTLIRLLALLTRPSSGRIELGGHDAIRAAAEAKRLLGVVLHESLLYADLTVTENLALAAALYSVTEPRRRLNEVTAQLELEPFAGVRVRTLSRGQRQRASIARALVHDPVILLLDEPDTGLDASAFERIWRTLAGPPCRTIIFSTHHPGHAIDLGTHLLLLTAGRGISLGDASDWNTAALAQLLLEAGSGMQTAK